MLAFERLGDPGRRIVRRVDMDRVGFGMLAEVFVHGADGALRDTALVGLVITAGLVLLLYGGGLYAAKPIRRLD